MMALVKSRHREGPLRQTDGLMSDALLFIIYDLLLLLHVQIQHVDVCVQSVLNAHTHVIYSDGYCSDDLHMYRFVNISVFW